MTVGADTPYGRAVTAERQRLQTLLDARTNPDGTAKRGLRTNVAEIRKRLAALPATSEPAVAS